VIYEKEMLSGKVLIRGVSQLKSEKKPSALLIIKLPIPFAYPSIPYRGSQCRGSGSSGDT